MIKLLHAEELARLAGVHKSTILLAIRRGELRASRTVGRSARITPEDAKAYLLTRGREVPAELDFDARRSSLSVLTENPDVLTMVRNALPPGVEFIEAGSLYGTLITVGSRLPGILVIDLDMVFMSPVPLIRALRSSASLRGSHIIALGLRDDLFGAARNVGASDVIIKIDTRTLTNRLHRLAGIGALRD